jgi:hypothetical protein
MTLIKSLHSSDPDAPLFQLHLSTCSSVCSCNTYTGGSHVEAPCRCSELLLINIVVQFTAWTVDMSVSGALVEDGDNLGQVSP